VTSAREDLARAERRRDAGLATDADVLALVVHLADLQHRAIQSEGDAAVARAELNRLMGAPIQQTFQAVAPMDDIAGPAPDATALLEEAGRARPELRRAEAARRLSDAVRKQARAALMPRLFATAVVDASGTQFDDRASAWIAGGEVRWTFSAGGAERARQKAAVEAAARASAESDDVRLAVQVDVITALSRLNAARAREAAGRSSVEQARESQRIVRDRFEAGMAGVTDVLRASTARLESEANRVSALVDTMVSGAMLRRAVGRTP
jgi:outer membrane protein TolC